MTAPKIVLRKAEDLAPSATNARTHSAEQLAQLKASLVQFGFTNPLLVDADGVIAGHGRLAAALELIADGTALRFPGGSVIGKGLVPTIDVSGWTPDQRRAYMLADNQLALKAGWDEDLLIAEIEALTGVGFDLDTLGFDAAALAGLEQADGTARSGSGGGSEGDTTYEHSDQFGVIVVCKDEAEQEAVFNRLKAEGLNVKVVVV